MLKTLYALYDKKTRFFHPPICCINDGDMMRMMSRLVAGDGTIWRENAEDFDVYEVGRFEDSCAEVIQDEKPKVIVNLMDIREALERKGRGNSDEVDA